MIYGIGCDLCRIARIKEILESKRGHAFAARVFGPAERTALGLTGAGGGEMTLTPNRAGSAAADFAAKEAFFKAAGVGLGCFALDEIESVRLPSGAPEYQLHGAAAQWVRQNGLTAHLSLSHDGGLALAYCVLERRAPAGGGPAQGAAPEAREE